MALGEKPYPSPSPRMAKHGKAGGGWPNKWSALVLVLVASVMLLLQTEVSVFSGHLTQGTDLRNVGVSKIPKGISNAREMAQLDLDDVNAEGSSLVGEEEPGKTANVVPEEDSPDGNQENHSGANDLGESPRKQPVTRSSASSDEHQASTASEMDEEDSGQEAAPVTNPVKQSDIVLGTGEVNGSVTGSADDGLFIPDVKLNNIEDSEKSPGDGEAVEDESVYADVRKDRKTDVGEEDATSAESAESAAGESRRLEDMDDSDGSKGGEEQREQGEGEKGAKIQAASTDNDLGSEEDKDAEMNENGDGEEGEKEADIHAVDTDKDLASADDKDLEPNESEDEDEQIKGAVRQAAGNESASVEVNGAETSESTEGEEAEKGAQTQAAGTSKIVAGAEDKEVQTNNSAEEDEGERGADNQAKGTRNDAGSDEDKEADKENVEGDEGEEGGKSQAAGNDNDLGSAEDVEAEAENKVSAEGGGGANGSKVQAAGTDDDLASTEDGEAETNVRAMEGKGVNGGKVLAAGTDSDITDSEDGEAETDASAEEGEGRNEADKQAAGTKNDSVSDDDDEVGASENPEGTKSLDDKNESRGMHAEDPEQLDGESSEGDTETQVNGDSKNQSTSKLSSDFNESEARGGRELTLGVRELDDESVEGDILAEGKKNGTAVVQGEDNLEELQDRVKEETTRGSRSLPGAGTRTTGGSLERDSSSSNIGQSVGHAKSALVLNALENGPKGLNNAKGEVQRGQSASGKSSGHSSSSKSKKVQQPKRVKGLRCRGREVYMYDLPKMFNADFVANCKHIHRSINMCKTFNNSGMGRPARVKKSKEGGLLELLPRGTWFESDQFSLEITFHARMLEYPCLTTDPSKATVFYVPFFPGLAIFRSLYEKDLVERDRHANLVIEWLGKLPYWDRHHGRDHLFVVTRVLIDFTRGLVLQHWGNTFMRMSHMLNATVLGIESHSHKALQNAVSVPYPTSFHPATDKDVQVWQDFMRSFKRKHRIAFGGVGHGMGAQIRFQLMELCARSRPHCRLFHCGKRVCMRPHNVIWHYANAHFCFQPPGDTPTRKGMFDCMLAGGIPGLFHEETAYRYTWHLPADHGSYSVYQSRTDFWKDNGTSILERLKNYPMKEIERLRENVIRLIPSIVYAMPGQTLKEYWDAFDISVENVVQKVSKLQLPNHPRLPKHEWKEYPQGIANERR